MPPVQHGEIIWDGCLYYLNYQIESKNYRYKGVNTLHIFIFSKLSVWNLILKSELP